MISTVSENPADINVAVISDPHDPVVQGNRSQRHDWLVAGGGGRAEEAYFWR